jgi:hypothetical protein
VSKKPPMKAAFLLMGARRAAPERDRAIVNGVSTSRLAEAYQLLGRFKRGEIPAGTDISEPEMELLLLLRGDLLPERPDLDADFPKPLLEVATVDSAWNQQTSATLDALEWLKRGGDQNRFNEERQKFLDACPPVWYRRIVLAV